MFKPCKWPAKNCPSTGKTGRFSGGVTPIEWLNSKVSTVAVFFFTPRNGTKSPTCRGVQNSSCWDVQVCVGCVGCLLLGGLLFRMLFHVLLFLDIFFVNPKFKMQTAKRTSWMVVYSRSSSLFGWKLGNIIPTCFSQIGGFCKPERDFVAGRRFDGIFFSCNLYMLHACWHMLLILAELCIATPAKHLCRWFQIWSRKLEDVLSP